MTSLEVRLDALQRAVDVGGDRLDPRAAASAAEVVRRGRERAEVGRGGGGSSADGEVVVPATATVIALAGATGSGKSSLFNALTGLGVAEVSARRPTTSVPSAVVWGEVPDALLDWLGIPQRHRAGAASRAGEQDPLHGLVLLDLPDHDSTDLGNKLQVDHLVDLVDLVIWVVDPQKYADDALHTGYLRALTGHQELLLVVLNQVDRLSEDGARDCEADLRRLLVADGLDRVHVVRTSARTGEGVVELRGIIAGAVAATSASVRRTEADVAVAAGALTDGVAAGEPDLGSLDGAGQLVDVLASAAGVPTVLDAVETSERRRGRALTGWPVTRWIGRRLDPLRRLHLTAAPTRGAAVGGVDADDPGEELRRATRSSVVAAAPVQRARVALAARKVAGQASEGLPQRWGDAVRAGVGAATDDVTGSLADALDQALLTVPVTKRAPVWQRAVGVVQTLLALVLVVGLVWTLGWAGVQWLQLPVLGPLRIGAPPLDVPLPWVLLAAAVVAGIVVSALCAPLVRARARRRRRRVEVVARAAVAEVAQEHLLDVVAGVLTDHRATREALAVVTAAGVQGGRGSRGSAPGDRGSRAVGPGGRGGGLLRGSPGSGVAAR